MMSSLCHFSYSQFLEYNSTRKRYGTTQIYIYTLNGRSKIQHKIQGLYLSDPERSGSMESDQELQRSYRQH